MKLQYLLSRTRRAVEDYSMIKSGDKIAVGVSGGKDSLAMLCALNALKRFYPEHFEIEVFTVDLGFKTADFSDLSAFCENLGLPFHLVKTNIAEIIFEQRKEKNPCSLCAKMRKGSLNEAAAAAGCNKVAYAHHRDDCVETMMMSLIYEGRFHCFAPVTYLDRMELTVIRPFLYVTEPDIISFQNENSLPVMKNPCPADGYTKRQYAKELVDQIDQKEPGVRERMFSALKNGGLSNWNDPFGSKN